MKFLKALRVCTNTKIMLFKQNMISNTSRPIIGRCDVTIYYICLIEYHLSFVININYKISIYNL